MNNYFKDIINKHKGNVRKVIKSVTGAHNEDLEQEVYIKTWKNIDKYSEKGKMSQWIRSIAGNVSRDYLKSRGFRQENLCDKDEEKVLNIADYRNPEKKLDREQRQEIIVKAINELGAKYKEVLLLFEIEGFSIEQISKKIKCPEGTVKSRLFNARKKLSHSLCDLI